MAPDAFDGHLEVDQDGQYEIVRLPAETDPMLQRVRAIQLRDDMLVDTINSYYEVYYNDLWQPYSDWRKLYSEELVAMKEVKKQAITRQLLGLAAIIVPFILGVYWKKANRAGALELVDDGDLDAAVGTIGGQVALLRNSGAGGNWLTVDLGVPHPGVVVTARLADGRDVQHGRLGSPGRFRR